MRLQDPGAQAASPSLLYGALSTPATLPGGPAQFDLGQKVTCCVPRKDAYLSLQEGRGQRCQQGWRGHVEREVQAAGLMSPAPLPQCRWLEPQMLFRLLRALSPHFWQHPTDLPAQSTLFQEALGGETRGNATLNLIPRVRRFQKGLAGLEAM